jgi:DNA-binding response OmpR family regulator
MKPKILIVDDEVDFLRAIEGHLSAAGFDVICAENGLEGEMKAGRDLPQLVLLDLRIPGMDGLTLCDRLKHSPATSAIPVIMMTGLSSELGRSTALETGANDYLLKPFQFSELLCRINFLLGLQRPEPVSSPGDTRRPG